MNNQCPKCHSERVEISDSECICFACGYSVERWDFPMSRDYGGYVNRDWQQASRHNVDEVVPDKPLSVDVLWPIKMELTDLRKAILTTRQTLAAFKGKKKGDEFSNNSNFSNSPIKSNSSSEFDNL